MENENLKYVHIVSCTLHVAHQFQIIVLSIEFEYEYKWSQEASAYSISWIIIKAKKAQIKM